MDTFYTQNIESLDNINAICPTQQPLIIELNGQEAEMEYFVKLDSKFLPCGDSFLKATDILYKCYYVFNVEYAAELKRFFNYMDVFVYKMDSVAALSAVESLDIYLKSFEENF